MAETRIFMPLCAAPQRVSLNPVALGLRPRDVTGVQRAQVLGHERLISFLLRFIHGADAPWLDSCDKHRNEGGVWDGRAETAAFA